MWFCFECKLVILSNWKMRIYTWFFFKKILLIKPYMIMDRNVGFYY